MVCRVSQSWMDGIAGDRWQVARAKKDAGNIYVLSIMGNNKLTTLEKEYRLREDGAHGAR